MSLQHAAHHLAAQGRGPDTELIHMTKGEIAGLQALAKAHGGSLTVNPHTGLAEAGFLSDILPMALGAGITYLSGGTIPAWQIGLGMGALGTLATGNLGKGLMTGLGAYGGAGLAGMAGLGTSEAGANLSQALEGATPVPGSPVTGAQAINNATGTSWANAVDGATPVPGSPVTGAQAIAEATKPMSFMEKVAADPMSAAKYTGAALLPHVLEQPKRTSPLQTQGDTDLGQKYSYSPGVASPFPQASPTGVEQNYFPGQGYTKISAADAKALYGYADGGDVQFPYGESVMRMRSGGLSDFDAPTKPKVADRDNMKKPAGLSDMAGLDDMEDLRKTKGLYAAGGLSDLGGYSDGGRLLRGPGDGVSDSIPATIGNKQPARLADGEFVVPARIVSELGNGSTDAGARQLYKMMDRVQKARGKTVGKGKVAKNSRADRFLPA